jgi:hypothetical protein
MYQDEHQVRQAPVECPTCRRKVEGISDPAIALGYVVDLVRQHRPEAVEADDAANAVTLRVQNHVYMRGLAYKRAMAAESRNRREAEARRMRDEQRAQAEREKEAQRRARAAQRAQQRHMLAQQQPARPNGRPARRSARGTNSGRNSGIAIAGPSNQQDLVPQVGPGRIRIPARPRQDSSPEVSLDTACFPIHCIKELFLQAGSSRIHIPRRPRVPTAGPSRHPVYEVEEVIDVDALEED